MDAHTVAAKHFESWKSHDFSTFRSLLADDVTFVGSMGTAGNAEKCVEGIKGMSRFVTDIVIHKMWVDGPDVITWYELHTAHIEPLPTVNWNHIENGNVTRIRATFDPRLIAPLSR